VMPLFIDFQMPPPAEATYSVFDGPGIPCTSDTRPMKLAGPTVRQRKPATTVESRVCAEADDANAAATRRRETRMVVILTERSEWKDLARVGRSGLPQTLGVRTALCERCRTLCHPGADGAQDLI